ncbi:hypothetical protein EX011_21650 [Salmonella enterica]|nr:hypothetical protein [Salmonella enterica]EBL7042129.1 hypothetical protein [Salmonella enterica]EJF7575707.1 hypothetical protein [Salmonella enterica subsp. enterica]
MSIGDLIVTYIILMVVWVVCCWIMRGHKATAFFISASVVSLYWLFELLCKPMFNHGIQIVYTWMEF